jgi:hypothetical protein
MRYIPKHFLLGTLIFVSHILSANAVKSAVATDSVRVALPNTVAVAQIQTNSFEYHHLQLTLELPYGSTVLNGVAAWQVSPLEPKLNTMKFVNMRTDIKAVLVNEELAEFFMREDTLMVELAQPVDQHVRFKVEIMYQSDPEFGTFRRDSNMVWSSLNPGASRALMPVLVDSHTRVPTDIRVMVPNDWQAVANGRLLANILLPENKRIYHWRSDQPVSVGDISIIAGNLETYWSEVGSNSGTLVSLHHLAGDLSEQKGVQIIQNAKEVMAAAEKIMDHPLPFGNLNLVYLPDHLWDTRSAVSSIGYIYSNGPDVRTQVIRNVAHQYFGAARTGKDIQTEELILALNAVLSGQISRELDVRVDLSPSLDYPDWASNVWRIDSPGSWREALELDKRTHQRRGLYTNDQLMFFNLLQSHFRSVFRMSDESLNWAEILRLYGNGEQMQWPKLTLPDDELTERYTLIYQLDEETSRFQIELIPEDLYETRNLQLLLRMFVDGAVTDRELMISNQGDRIQLSPHGWVENMYVVDADENMIFTEIKPASFWLYQLRRDSDPARRIESAKGFGRVRDDPDVQLILLDLVRNEPDETVRAFLVESLSSIVGGAFGTHQRFVDLLRDPSILVRNSALMALENYSGNELVQRELFRIISQSQDIEYVNMAIGVYRQVVDEQEFYAVARGLLHEDQDELFFTETLIPLILKTEQGRSFAPNLMRYSTNGNPVSLRLTTFSSLHNVEIDVEYWQEILPELLSDTDPRIRYQSLSFISRLPQVHRETLLTDRSYNEFDMRVLAKVNSLAGMR